MTSATTWPPLPAISLAASESSLALDACSALFVTAPVSSCTELTVCWRAAACSSVRAERSMLPRAISAEPCAMASASAGSGRQSSPIARPYGWCRGEAHRGAPCNCFEIGFVRSPRASALCTSPKSATNDSTDPTSWLRPLVISSW